MKLYIKKFPLGKGISFTHYIDILDEKNFSPFTLLIKRVPKTKKVLIEVVLTDVTTTWGMLGSGFVMGGVLFNEITIEYSERGSFILQASVASGNLLLSFFYIVSFAFFLFFILFELVINNLPLGNLVMMLLAFAVGLYPVICTYLRQIRFLDRIGSLGSEMDEK
jgi:hypothetical protein